MTKQTLATLKSYFNVGDMPTEAQFSDVFESYTASPATLIVAASDAPQLAIDYADYVCDGVDDQVQIQAALDALPAMGGRLLLSEGTFTLKTGGSMTAVSPDPGGTDYYCVKISTTHPPLEIAGTPGATLVTLADGQSDSPYMFAIRGSGANIRTNPTRITGIEFDGNGPGQSAPPSTDYMPIIMGQFARSITVDHCRFRNWEVAHRVAIHTQYKTQKVTLTHNHFYGQQAVILENDYQIVSNNIFDDPIEVDNGYASLSLSADFDTLVSPGVYSTHWGATISSNIFTGGSIQLSLIGVHGVTVIGNSFADQSDAGRYCIHMVGDPAETGFDALNNTIIGNTFVNCQTPIKLTGSGTVGCRENIIALNTMGAGLDRGLNWGIIEGGGTTGNNIIALNHIEGGSGKLVSTGTNTLIFGNDGYITENSGSAASTADGGTIAHGCAATPTVATVSGSVAGEIVTVTAISSTTITVAIKKNDGSAGTTQTVYWRAEV